MRLKFAFTILLFSLILSIDCLNAQNQLSPPLPDDSKGFGAHDPVMIKQDSVYYVFTTGVGVSMASSIDLITWKREKPIFEKAPEWVTPEIVPGWRSNSMWAPDIQFFNGTYYLFYSVSAFAKNTSAIGVATNKTLHPNSLDYKWIDHGMVVQSIPNRDLWNAIDPNLIVDEKKQGWLSFGSFWGGIKLVKLSPDFLSVCKPEVWQTLARQPRTFALDDTDPGDGTIEAPFIMKRFQYYYLFVSLDYCCRGLNSDYNVVVGRSRNVEGPYVDENGILLSRGGGTSVAKGNEDWAGVGHNGICYADGKYYFVCHGYDNHDNGRSKLIVREINWGRSEWPAINL